jgi:two-component system sensor histidine kinase UhpB
MPITRGGYPSMHRRSLFVQILGINVLLVTAAMLAATVSANLNLHDLYERNSFLLVALAIATTLLVNAMVLRRRFAPLEQLIDDMERVDLSTPGEVRADVSHADSEEVERLARTFNRMLDRVEDERRSAARAVLRAQEDERARIAHDLHDEVNQALTAIILRLQASAHDAPPALERELDETRRLASQAMEELLTIARELRPTALDDHGLLPALQTQVANFGERTKTDATFQVHGQIPPLNPDQQLVIYRVTQESLSNIAQHAGASNVSVVLSFVGRIILKITDDGSGFLGTGQEAQARAAAMAASAATAARNNGSAKRPSGVVPSGGLGLSGMRERALLIGGKLTIDSNPGRGTTVTLVLGSSRSAASTQTSHAPGRS